MMEQYFRIKEQHKDCLLFFRLGDFYEMFGEDAIVGSKELEITLTSRDRGKDERMPLCGVPWHALDSYLPKLLSKGYKVAICEQMQDPRYAKGLVDRDVVRIVTPGTVIEGSVLDGKSNNYLMSIARSGDRFGLSFADISTGEFVTTEFGPEDSESRVLTEFSQRAPKEVLYGDGLGGGRVLDEIALSGAAMTKLDDMAFLKEASESMLKRHFGLKSLAGLGLSDKPLAVSSAGAILRYLESTQKRSLDFLGLPRFYSVSDKLILDQTTLRNLEVLRNVRDGRLEGTLVEVLDHALTPMGSRLLKAWVTEPLKDVQSIDRRLDAVGELVSDTLARNDIGSSLKGTRDLERLISKVMYGSANARDLLAVRDSLESVPEVREVLRGARSELLRELGSGMKDVGDVAGLISRSIAPDPPVPLKEGGLIREGFDPALDSLKAQAREGREWIASLEETERARTGIKNLRLGFNNVFGYYIEVSKANAKRVPADYERKQTLTTGERYVTPGLKEKEQAILAAKERSCGLEYEAFVKVRDEVARHGKDIRETARALAAADVLRSFAEAAVMYGYCRPKVDGSGTILLKDSRHPVVERFLRGSFVPNDVHLDTNLNRLIILTGPNMAGKSTYIRQVAQIVVMAQAGSFVPASEATIGIVDRVFTRVGAFDDLARGQSTFMVEMTELANILNSATGKSLILLDEVGRGTSTFDGLAIAWAVSEHLYDHNKVGAKTLFATHYHQLTELAETLEGVKNYSMSVKEQGSEVVFLRKVVPGKANKSYGIQVARLAGVPHEVVGRAEQVLSRIEEENVLEVKAGKKTHEQAFLTPASDEVSSSVLDELRSVDLSSMTPMEAYVKLNALRKKAGGPAGKDKGTR
ncbi:MAG: mismatch repair protein MutS [Candidatus Thermoplasmatota archaeon]|nr:mismatch repair protein MutS [Candidatus Thermoplasmatota archaeon]